MPLANKEVVHLKNGWEKIQVRKKYYHHHHGVVVVCDERRKRARFLSLFLLPFKSVPRRENSRARSQVWKLLTRFLSFYLSLSYYVDFFPQTGIQKLKNLLDNPNENGANGEEPRGFDAEEFMGHYTCVRLFFIFIFSFLSMWWSKSWREMKRLLSPSLDSSSSSSFIFFFLFVPLLPLPPPFRRRYRRYSICVERKWLTVSRILFLFLPACSPLSSVKK